LEDPLDREMTYTDPSAFSFYRDFMNVEEARAITSMLEENKIPFRLESSDTVIDKAIVGNGLLPKAVLKLLPDDFRRVNQLISVQYQDLSYADVKDHYLNDLDNEELEEIFEKQDEWTIENVNIARIILEERGIVVEEEEIKEQRAERLESIRAGKAGSKFWMSAYFLALISGLFISIILVVAGLGMSFYYAYGRSTDADGNQHFVYDENTRFLGTIMLYGGMAMLIVEILIMAYLV